MSASSARLSQALKHFQERTHGEELPKGTQEAVAELLKTLSGGVPTRDTPGGRAALKVAPGTNGTGEPMEKAAKGIDGPSPGQRAARGEADNGLSSDIAKAAAEIIAQHNA